MFTFAPVLAYINDYWPHVIRHHPEDEKTRIGLPYPYAVPSDGAMFQEMYYWDSYFMGLGLVGSLESKPGRQWAYPNGWAPLQWLVVAGLERYGYHGQALRIAEKWCMNCAQVFAATGAMWEKYNVVELDRAGEQGLYGHVKGFG